MEEYDKKVEFERVDQDDIFSKSVRAGKRTYFFDVKATRNSDNYLTITESKKRYEQDGKFQFEKHKIFLYKEDFDKFIAGLQEAIDFIKANQAEMMLEPELVEEETYSNSYSDIAFEDLKG